MMGAKTVSCLLSTLLLLTVSGCSDSENEAASTTPPAESEVVSVTEADFTVDTPIADVMSDPAFDGFGRLLFPVDSGYWDGDTLGELRLTWYSHIDPDKTVEIVNTLKSNALAGKTVFYDIYTDEE